MKKLFLFLSFLLFSFPLFSDVTDAVKEQARIYREEGYQIQQRGDIQAAAVLYQKALTLDPSYAEAYNDMGVILEQMGDVEQAIAMYQKAVQYQPAFLPAHTNLAFTYEAIDNREMAVYHWKQRCLLSSIDDYWRREAIEHLKSLGVYDQVKQELLAPQATLYFNEFSARREQERSQAIAQAKLHLQKALNYASGKNYKEAAAELSAALSLNPADEDLVSRLSQEHQRVQKEMKKENIKVYLKNALTYVEQDQYKMAVQSLKEGLSAIFSIEN